MPYYLKYDATVFPSLSYKFGSCSHSLGGIIPNLAQFILTVSPFSSLLSGLMMN